MMDEGVEISARKLRDDKTLQDFVRNSSQYIPAIQLVGERKADEDRALLDEISTHCSQTTETLIFFGMCLNLPASNLKVFPLLSKIVFVSCLIENDTILRFDEWCPNVTKIQFQRSVRFSDDAFNSFISTEFTFPRVKAFAFDFGHNYDLTREYLTAFNQKFPALEQLELSMDTDDFSKYEPEFNVPYEPLYFKNLKKLDVFAFGTDIDQLFDYMAISNVKLKELTFSGMSAPKKLMTFIQNSKRLGKLTFRCPYFHEEDINDLDEMKWLREVMLDVKNFYWEPKDMLTFVRKQKGLKVLTIESDRKCNQIKYDKEFQQMFDDLVKERGKLKIKVLFCEGGREMQISEKGFSETRQYEVSSSDSDSPSDSDSSSDSD